MYRDLWPILYTFSRWSYVLFTLQVFCWVYLLNDLIMTYYHLIFIKHVPVFHRVHIINSWNDSLSHLRFCFHKLSLHLMLGQKRHFWACLPDNGLAIRWCLMVAMATCLSLDPLEIYRGSLLEAHKTHWVLILNCELLLIKSLHQLVARVESIKRSEFLSNIKL